MLLSCCMILHCTASPHGFSCLSCIDTKYSDPEWLALAQAPKAFNFFMKNLGTFNMGKRNLNLELFVVVSWMNSWVSPFIIPDIICFGFFTLDTRMVKFFMKLGVKFHSFFLEKKGEIFVPFTLFEKWKWNENDWKSRSRSESEIKMTRDRDREVKFQKNSREFSRIETLAGHW